MLLTHWLGRRDVEESQRLQTDLESWGHDQKQ